MGGVGVTALNKGLACRWWVGLYDGIIYIALVAGRRCH